MSQTCKSMALQTHPWVICQLQFIHGVSLCLLFGACNNNCTFTCEICLHAVSTDHKTTQKPLELPPMSQPNVCPHYASGPTHYRELADVKSLQVHGMVSFIAKSFSCF
jgi:hypothetical protein